MTGFRHQTPFRAFGRTVAISAIAISASLTFAMPAYATPPPGSPMGGGVTTTTQPITSGNTPQTQNGNQPITSGNTPQTQGSSSSTATIQDVGNVNFNTKNIQKLSNWLDWLALLSCIIGICISSALWALGSKGQNPGQELTGKKGLILCCTAAFFVGALPHMLSWLEGAAHQADTTGVTGTGGSSSAAQPTQQQATGDPTKVGGSGVQQNGGKVAGCVLPTARGPIVVMPTANCH